MARIMGDQALSGPTPPRWAGDYFNREHLLPGGVVLDASQFTDTTHIPSGTVVSRKNAETAFGPADEADDVFYIIAFDVDDVTVKADAELYRHGGIVKTNFLPVYDALHSDIKAALADKYELTTGV